MNIVFAISSLAFLLAYTALIAIYGSKLALSFVVTATLVSALSQYLAQADDVPTRRIAIVCTYLATALYVASLVAFLLGQ